MTAIKHTLQREVFLPKERLVAVVHVTKAGKKKKESFLCATVTTEKPIQALVHQVKKADRGDSYKKKLSWMLRELKLLDAKSDHPSDTAEFEMQFEKGYKWIASSPKEKISFIQCLWTLSQRYVVQKPEFTNMPVAMLEDSRRKAEVDQTVEAAEELALAGDSDWQALTPREENDLETLMSQCEYAISNTEAFTHQLAQDLSVLDGANIHSIMASEDQVMELMMLIDLGLTQAIGIEERLDDYASKLQSVKDMMDMLRDKDTLIKVRGSNHQKLLDQLNDMVSQLDLPTKHVKALLDHDLSTAAGIRGCTEAAKRLHHCMSAEIPPSLLKMAAVQEQQKRFAKYKTAFTKRLSHHLNNFFIHQGNELGETLSRYANDLKLPRHTSSHSDLLPYADLMFWLKQSDSESFNKLVKVYTTSLRKLYDRETHDFIETAKQRLPQIKLDRRGTLKPVVQGGSSGSLNRGHESRGSFRSPSQNTLDSDSVHGSDPDVSNRTKFDQMFEHVLSELGPVCLAEQDFCVKFFSLTADEENTTDSSVVEAEEGEGPWQMPKAATPRQRKINEQVRQMMGDLFPSLETELNNFITYGDKMDSFNSMYMLVRMSTHVINAEDTGSFLSKSYGNCLVRIKRIFDNFVKMQMDAINESRLSKKSKVGIIPFVHRFAEFSYQAETIFKGSERRTDLDKAYQRLVSCVFDQINRIALESQKTPREVVLFENYHHMYAVFSRLKIASLETQRKDMKQKYQDHLQSYVTACLGHPMEKLHVFFVGVESRVAAGVKEEEVGYQLAYSKQELRKLIKEYPCKEVKRSLEHLYRKVEKQLCEEENLLQVVWHSMQELFLKQYSHFETLISKCYPGAGITMEFTITDLLGYFSDIAQSH